MRVDRTPDERRHLQVRQSLDAVPPNSGAPGEVDALGAHAADHVEQRDGTAVPLVVDGLGQENRVRDLQARLLAYLAAHGVLDGLAVLDRPAEPGPAVRVGDPWLVIAMVEEQ